MRINKVNEAVANANEFGGEFASDYINPVAPINVASRAKIINLVKVTGDFGFISAWAATMPHPSFEADFAIWEAKNPNANSEEIESARLYILGASFCNLELEEIVKLNVTGN